jgi:hypothetical protein
VLHHSRKCWYVSHVSFSVPCPFCAQPIREEAFRCSHCHAWLVPWSYRHKWVQGLLGLGGGVFLIYDGVKERYIDAPSWLLWLAGAFIALYGFYHLFRAPREAFEEGRKELLARYRKPDPEPEEEEDEE